MRLGICYNAFDGLELLEGSIRAIRHIVHYVCVVYQETSNFGNPMSDKDREIMERLKETGIVSKWVQYAPDNSGGHTNETHKRNIGLNLCRDAGCTHFMSMDCDEYYKDFQLQAVKHVMVNGDYDSSVCQMQTYWKSVDYVLDPPEEYYVPLIYSIDDRKFDKRECWPVLVDPTRRMRPGKILILKRNEIEMHHLSYVRDDIRSKLINSSASVNFKDRIDDLVDYYENWEYPQPASLAGRGLRLHQVVKLPRSGV